MAVELINNKVARVNLSKSIVSILLLCFSSSIALAQAKPNIVLVFMDNFGWGEPGFNAAE